MTVRLSAEPVWCAAQILLAVMAAVCLGVWVLVLAGVWGRDPFLAWGVAAGVALVAGLTARRATTCEPVDLSWTGQTWQMTPAISSLQALTSPQACQPAVMIDLGNWMLLRLHTPGRTGGRVWRAVSQRLLGPQWHGLRVALYGAHERKAPAGGGAQAEG